MYGNNVSQMYLCVSLTHGLVERLVLSDVRLEHRNFAWQIRSIASLTPTCHTVYILLSLVVENDAEAENRRAFIKPGGELLPGAIKSTSHSSYVAGCIVLRLKKPSGHRQDFVDVYVHVHRVHGKVLVIFLQVLCCWQKSTGVIYLCNNRTGIQLEAIFTQLIRSPYFDVVGQKVLAIVADPLEHFLAVLLEHSELEALVELLLLDVPELQ